MIRLLRYSTTEESTLGLLFDGPGWLCHVLEDPPQSLGKIPGRTRIPEGIYSLELRTSGGFHERYAKRFPAIHRGMIWLRQVPGFTWILFHCGNTAEDTSGCLLAGTRANNNQLGMGRIYQSADAYVRAYPIIAAQIERGPLSIDVRNA